LGEFELFPIEDGCPVGVMVGVEVDVEDVGVEEGDAVDGKFVGDSNIGKGVGKLEGD